MIVIDTWFLWCISFNLLAILISTFFLIMQVRNLGGWVHSLSELILVKNKQDEMFDSLRDAVRDKEERDKMLEVIKEQDLKNANEQK